MFVCFVGLRATVASLMCNRNELWLVFLFIFFCQHFTIICHCFFSDGEVEEGDDGDADAVQLLSKVWHTNRSPITSVFPFPPAYTVFC